MIGEEINNQTVPQTSISKGKSIAFIVECIKEVPEYFLLAINTEGLIKPLNENKYTQILVEQINCILGEKQAGIHAQNQYSDLFYGTKGIPDFYFHELEKGKTNKPLFVVESKILPAPAPKEREKEYVIGTKQNGGIERFKLEKHAKGLEQCGMVGFILEESFVHWETQINSWIDEMVQTDTFWKSDEKIEINPNETKFNCFTSIAQRNNTSDILIHHFWMKL